MKKCNKCGQVKPVSEFYKHKGHKDGLSSYCKKCINKRCKKYNQLNKEKIRKQKREYNKEYLQKEDVKKRRKEADKKYKKKHRKTINEKAKKYYQRPEVKRRIKKYRQRPEVKKRLCKNVKRYQKTSKGQLSTSRSNYKRRNRNMKDIFIFDNFFPNEIVVRKHHLLNDFYDENKEDPAEWFIIVIPYITHKFVGGRAIKREHWQFCAEWIEKIYCFDIKSFLMGEDSNCL